MYGARGDELHVQRKGKSTVSFIQNRFMVGIWYGIWHFDHTWTKIALVISWIGDDLWRDLYRIFS